MVIYREKSHFGVVEARPGELMLSLEGMSSPRRAGCLSMKLFHGPSEPDASLGELGSRKNKKNGPFCPLPWYLFVFLIKTLSDSLLHIVTDAKYRNLTSKNQNIISNDIPRTKLGSESSSLTHLLNILVLNMPHIDLTIRLALVNLRQADNESLSDVSIFRICDRI